jgi:mycothiol synthase
MVHVRTLRALDAHQHAAVSRFLDDAATDWRATLNDHLRSDLAEGPRAGFLAAEAFDEHEALVGYAQASPGNHGFVVDAIVAPDGDDTRLRLLSAVIAALPADAAITWWTHEGDDAARSAAQLGLGPGRALLQMRRPLPPEVSTDVPVRPFVVGADEAAWLEVNNAAFAWHGEQGGWDLPTLQQRERAPWFRPDGFLLHERDGRLAAFCWTKLHPPAVEGDAVVGEIYVIAVHPDFHGRGLGKALTVAGLAWLHTAGATAGMLYVDADNSSAVAMYRALGFQITNTDQAYIRPTA